MTLWYNDVIINFPMDSLSVSNSTLFFIPYCLTMVQLPCVSIVKGASKGSIFRLLRWEVSPPCSEKYAFWDGGVVRCGMWVFSLRGGLRAGCESISTRAQYLTPDRIYCENVKMCRFSQEIDFSALNSFSLLWLVNGATQLWTSKKECNKLNLTAAQYFWLVQVLCY
jgi:hypothetical protein